MEMTLEELELLKVLAHIIDLEENQKLYHSLRVAMLSQRLSEILSAADSGGANSTVLFTAGLLHDIGTFDLSNRLIHLKDHMENIAVAGIRVHPQKGAGIVAALPGFIPQAEMILDHHEWINGAGYPRKRREDQLSPGSRILRISDKFAFMADTDPGIQPSTLHSSLKSRINREFTAEMYDCLMDEITATDIWDIVCDERRMDDEIDRIMAEIPIREYPGSQAVNDLFHILGRVLDAKHSYTEGHSRRVAYFSVLIALALGLPEEDVRRVEIAGYLHDLGKLAIPSNILDKDGPLTDEEFEIIKTHAGLTQDIVRGIARLHRLEDAVGADQEHWDGSGYPRGLKGEEIPLEARIVFVADAFDAMTSHRSYHRAISSEEAVKELKRCAGRDFDPAIVSEAATVFDGFANPSIEAGYYEDTQES